MGIFNDDMYTQEEVERYKKCSFWAGYFLGEFVSIAEYYKKRWEMYLLEKEFSLLDAEAMCRDMNYRLKELRPLYEIKCKKIDNETIRIYAEEKNND